MITNPVHSSPAVQNEAAAKAAPECRTAAGIAPTGQGNDQSPGATSRRRPMPSRQLPLPRPAAATTS